jgi:ABC-type phosphate transport system auxiliary subunit
MSLVAVIVDPTARVYSFEVPPADGKKIVGTPTRATNSMPRQRLRSIPIPVKNNVL